MISSADAYEAAAYCLNPIKGGEIHHHQTAADRIACAIVAAGTHKSKPHIRDTIIIFAEAMDRKLRRDDDKKCAWETDLLAVLRDELAGEYLELRDALHIYENTTDDPEGKALMLECVDLANQAMMIFSQLHPLTRHNRRGVAQHRLPRP